MKTISLLLDSEWYDRYRRIANLNIRSSIYDVTNRCNLRCRGCFFFSSGENHVKEETNIKQWEAFIDKERKRGVNLAILIGGEPTLCMDRVEAFYKRLPSYCATNGLIKIPRDKFPDMMVGISLWGSSEDEKILRGKDTFAISSKNYEGDPYTYYLYTITPKQVGKIESVVKRIVDVGLKVHLQLLSNDEGMEGFSWRPEELRDLRFEMDEMLDQYPRTVISCKYYHEIITTGKMMGRTFGWRECSSVTESLDNRQPPVKRLIHFYRWAADLKTVHRCCTSATRDCSTCKDGAAHMSWVMVNKRDHLNSTRDLQNWIEVYEMFAKLYRLIPW
ncbi:MAG TPA: radical SAM protein [Smithellaceae bacterium]|nr:MAG: Cyclic pyranopterin monophosphate synthase [Deltaproteobacteria bacterium ADurb.BinA014]HOF78472.1 radical SAM protein [Smithellaceae bacterium]HOM69746.1 radical SAM protein [Smithellaceae bacterium]HOS09516.1 radical SAM protein [Smithellaceae bacterium]HOU04679.1 radical SAM protein [Smithellaceae bacterium]